MKKKPFDSEKELLKSIKKINELCESDKEHTPEYKKYLDNLSSEASTLSFEEWIIKEIYIEISEVEIVFDKLQDEIQQLKDEAEHQEERADQFEFDSDPEYALIINNLHDRDKLEIIQRIFYNLTLVDLQVLEANLQTSHSKYNVHI